MYIILAILAFGIIIAIHELGHFLTAKAMDVKVLEFSIGMGPKILSRQGKETLYSLRLIPFGGFCSMEGEYGERLEKDSNEPSPDEPLLAEGIPEPERFEPYRAEPAAPGEPDPRAFNTQKMWKKIVILAAGSIANIVMAFIIMLALSAGAEGYGTAVLDDVIDTLPDRGQSEIMPGDKIVAVNGERIYYYNDYALFMNINAGKPVTITLSRGGELIEYQRRSYNVDGNEVYRYVLSFNIVPPSLTENIKYSAYQTFNFIRMIRVSVAMMVSGQASVTEVAGPVGIVSAMNTVGRESPDVFSAIINIIYFMAFIGVNVAAINLLPIPAMDGGRILFILVTFVIEKLTRRQLDPKYENYINTGAFAVLIGLMVIIMYNDIIRLIGG